MIAVALLAWAAVLGVVAPRLLLRASWTERAPRLGMIAWQATSVSMLTALVLGGVTLAIPVTALSGDLTEVLSHCVMSVRDAYRTPAGAAAAGAGLVLAGSVVARLAYVGVSQSRTAVRRQRAHADALTLLGSPHPSLGAVVVDHPVPAAYCLPGRVRRIVVTTGALAALDKTQLGAVLAHERAHLKARHHLAVAAASALSRAFPRIPLLRDADAAIPALVEMAADDAAGARVDRTRVAGALVALAGAATPAGALAAGGGTALTRVRRMLRPAAPLSRAARAATLVTAGLLLIAPAALAVVPAAATGNMPDCLAHAPRHF